MEIDKNMMTNIEGLYAAGDSSGYGSGLNIAAVMGILAVRHILTLNIKKTKGAFILNALCFFRNNK